MQAPSDFVDLTLDNDLAGNQGQSQQLQQAYEGLQARQKPVAAQPTGSLMGAAAAGTDAASAAAEQLAGRLTLTDKELLAKLVALGQDILARAAPQAPQVAQQPAAEVRPALLAPPVQFQLGAMHGTGVRHSIFSMQGNGGAYAFPTAGAQAVAGLLPGRVEQHPGTGVGQHAGQLPLQALAFAQLDRQHMLHQAHAQWAHAQQHSMQALQQQQPWHPMQQQALQQQPWHSMHQQSPLQFGPQQQPWAWNALDPYQQAVAMRHAGTEAALLQQPPQAQMMQQAAAGDTLWAAPAAIPHRADNDVLQAAASSPNKPLRGLGHQQVEERHEQQEEQGQLEGAADNESQASPAGLKRRAGTDLLEVAGQSQALASPSKQRRAQGQKERVPLGQPHEQHSPKKYVRQPQGESFLSQYINNKAGAIGDLLAIAESPMLIPELLKPDGKSIVPAGVRRGSSNDLIYRQLGFTGVPVLPSGKPFTHFVNSIKANVDQMDYVQLAQADLANPSDTQLTALCTGLGLERGAWAPGDTAKRAVDVSLGPMLDGQLQDGAPIVRVVEVDGRFKQVTECPFFSWGAGEPGELVTPTKRQVDYRLHYLQFLVERYGRRSKVELPSTEAFVCRISSCGLLQGNQQWCSVPFSKAAAEGQVGAASG